MNRFLAVFASGLLFALGLGVSGMTQPDKVLAFLDVAGKWDPSLAFVMVGAIGTYAVLSRLIQRRSRPVFEASFSLTNMSGVDRRLLGGAALFGGGWGLAGYCPGPAIVSVVTLQTSSLVFVGSMLAGMFAFGFLEPKSRGISLPVTISSDNAAE